MDRVLADRLLWAPKSPESTRMHLFQRHIQDKYGVEVEGYEELRQWSLANLNEFWQEVWLFTGIRASSMFTTALDADRPMYPRPAFFRGAKLNFAENLLYPLCNPEESSPAVMEASEESRRAFTWAQLRERVRQCSVALRNAGVVEGDRVAGFVANTCDALVAMLGATSIGALWTAISPDTGVHAALERMQQVDPKILFTDNAVVYNGKVHSVHDKLKNITKQLPMLKACVVFETVLNMEIDLSDIFIQAGTVMTYAEFVQSVSSDTKLVFAQLQPDHGIYILYTSGTTGQPKAIVHGAIGTLIQHKKEHDLQCNLHSGDLLFYYTTCSWMMWHWLVSGLATGATIVLYNGSPFRPLQEDGTGDLAMPKLIEELGITHFGTSAKYLSILEQKGVMVNTMAKMQHLQAIYSTGSPLAPSTFEYVYRAFGNIRLASITGGTDIISLFGAPSPISPVFAGEIQARGLGMAVEAWDSDGRNVTDTGEPGDLVCIKPFPCQPIKFWGAAGEEKYKSSYFEKFAGVWYHGDFVRLNPRTGGLVMLGRSDGVLKPAGVRFGSSEIYNVVSKYFQEVEDSLCIGRRREHEKDESVILFVKMSRNTRLSPDLAKQIKATIKEELSPRHVPQVIDQCPDIPVTVNGKKVEVAVKQILCGTNIKASASVANAGCLDWFHKWSENHRLITAK